MSLETENTDHLTGDTDSSQTELLADKNQRLIAYGAIVGSVMLALQHAAVASHFHGWPQMLVTALSLIGWGAFGLGTIRSVRLKRTPEGRAFMEHLASDERLVSIRARSFAAGFFAMLGMQVVLLLLWVILGHLGAEWLNVAVAAPATIAAGVTGSVLRFQNLSNR